MPGAFPRTPKHNDSKDGATETGEQIGVTGQRTDVQSFVNGIGFGESKNQLDTGQMSGLWHFAAEEIDNPVDHAYQGVFSVQLQSNQREEKANQADEQKYGHHRAHYKCRALHGGF